MLRIAQNRSESLRNAFLFPYEGTGQDLRLEG